VLASFFLMFHMEALEGEMQPRLIEEEDHFAKPLLELLELCQIEHENSLDSIVEATQVAWFQRRKERWMFEDRYSDQKGAIMDLLGQLHVTDEILPLEETYDYVFIHGGLYSRAKARFQFLSRLLRDGLQFGQIVVLSGKRDLDLLLEKEVLQRAKTEIEMMKVAASETDLPGIPIVFVSAPNKEGRRPTTADTIIE